MEAFHPTFTWSQRVVAMVLGVCLLGASQAPMAGEPGAQAATLKILASMNLRTGIRPNGVILASNGNLYGTASGGGRHRLGTIFRTKPSGDTESLHDFAHGADGSGPSTLVQASDGAVYGMAGGSYDDVTGAGVIFRLTLDGQFSVVHVLNKDRTEGEGGGSMMQARDGYLYGTLGLGGGDGFCGVLFKMSLDGDYSVVARVSRDGPYVPNSIPLEGDDGTFYISALFGGAYNQGGLLRVKPDGEVTTLVEYTDPASPPAYDALHEAMYWTLARDGHGYIQRYRDGVEDSIAVIDGYAGELTLGPDGNFYAEVHGLGAEGGAPTMPLFDYHLYGISTSGEFWSVVELPSNTGSRKYAFNDAGTLFGSSSSGGDNDKGSVFKVKHFLKHPR